MLASNVTDQVKMLSQICGNAERLLHETVRLVSIAIRTFSRIHVCVKHFGVLNLAWRVECVASSLSFHFTICEKASRDSASAP